MPNKSQTVDRRTFLRGAGLSLALPFLETIVGSVVTETAMSGLISQVATSTAGQSHRRMVCVSINFGMNPGGFFPQKIGHNYTMPTLLKPLEPLRDDLTIFSHLDHPGMTGGHGAVHTYLSGVKIEHAKNMKEGNITVDQKAAEFVGADTRYPSLQIGIGGGQAISWSRNGVAIPSVSSLRAIFEMLFHERDARSKRALARSYDLDTSILDVVRDAAKSLERTLSKGDQDKLDEYFTSVRQVEKQMNMSEAWLDRPKPKVDYRLPTPEPTVFVDIVPLYYDLMRLALQTDSTRVISLRIKGWSGDPGLEGITQGYHTLTHHGKDPTRLKELNIVEIFHAQQYGRFLESLKSVQMGDGKSLLDETMVLLGSGLGNASSHSNKNLPLILSGGGFKHGEHKDYPKKGSSQTPACNLYLSMLQRFGLEVDRFGTSSGTLSGLEVDS